MSFKGKILIVSLSSALAFYAIVGGFLSAQKNVFAKGDPYVQLRIFGEVLRHIVRDYVDEPDLEKVRVGALRGLSEGLDPYSAYLTPEQTKKFQASRADQNGTGMIFSKVGGYIYLVSVLKGSPAEKVGLREGDFVEYLNGFATRDISLYDAEELISGLSGAEIEMKVFRRSRPYRVKLKRDKVAQPAIEASILEPGIGYLHITSLTDGKVEEIKKQILDLQKKGAQKLILDLRGVANGRIDAGVEVANFFVKSGTLAKTIVHNGTGTTSFEADASKTIFNGPVIIVAGKSTAGAGEVIAAALLANKRGELVGERTFGAGSEQKLFELKNGSSMLLTVVKYADPSGSPFMKENPGVAPTVEVKTQSTADDALPEDDDQNNANPEGQAVEEADPVLPIEPAPAEDLPLKKAIELIKGNGSQSLDKKVAHGETAAPAAVLTPTSQRASRVGSRL
jgi:carboxyl-terminal processing protease